MFAKCESNPASILQSKKTSLPKVEEPNSLVNNSNDFKVDKETFCVDHVAPKSVAYDDEIISVQNAKDYRNYESNSQSSLSSTSSSLSCSYPSDKSSLSDSKPNELTLIQNSQPQSSCELLTNVSKVSDENPSEFCHSYPDLLSSSANDKCHKSPVHKASDCHNIIQKDPSYTNENRQVLEVSTTMANLREYTRRSSEQENLAKEGRVRFRAVIEPSKNKLAEEELSREISKDMFAEVFY